MDSGGGDQKTTTQVNPPKFQTPYIEDVLSQAKGLYNQPGPYYYPGSTVANLNPVQQQSMQSALGYAGGGAQNIANASQAGYGMGLQFANPLNNPFFQQTAQAIARPLTQNLTQNYLPQVDSGAVLSGNIGSSRQGVAQGLGMQATQQALQDQLAQFGSGAYNTGAQTLLGTLGQTGNVQAAGLVPSQIQGAVGGNLQQYEQSLLNADQNRYNYYQQLPYSKLNQYAGLVGNPLGTSQTQTTPGAQTNPLTTLAGLGIGAGALNSAFPTALPAVGSWLSSLFSAAPAALPTVVMA